MNWSLALTASALLGLVSCETMNTPITSSDFDPLRPAGTKPKSSVTAEATFKPGQFVRASMDNTAFYLKKPSGEADADKLLKRETSMKVISNTSSYVKVELDGGEIGFVPTVMLEDPAMVAPILAMNAGETQVYPPLPSGGIGEPLPVFDPTGLPPEGAIPAVIDPEAPASAAPLPPVTPTTETFPTPPVDVTPQTPAPTPAASTSTESKPLPPNDDDLKTEKTGE